MSPEVYVIVRLAIGRTWLQKQGQKPRSWIQTPPVEGSRTVPTPPTSIGLRTETIPFSGPGKLPCAAPSPVASYFRPGHISCLSRLPGPFP